MFGIDLILFNATLVIVHRPMTDVKTCFTYTRNVLNFNQTSNYEIIQGYYCFHLQQY